MSWNKRDYYYQNQMKVLSGTDAEPGYKESDGNSLSETELKKRIDGVSGDDTKPGNGLYKFVSLIKAKFNQLRDSNWSLIDRNPSKSKLNNTDKENLNNLYGYNENDENNQIGNYYHKYHSDFNKENNHYPQYIDTDNYSTVLKVSAPAGAPGKSIYGAKSYYVRQNLLQNLNVNQYVRIRDGKIDPTSTNPGDGVCTEPAGWSPWYVFVPMTEAEAKELGLIDEHGEPQGWGKVFLKRKNDWTIGPTGFGIMPISGNQQQDVSQETKAKIVLGKYTYGKELPSVHYDSTHMNDSDIPKGQIYLQYDEQSSEG